MEPQNGGPEPARFQFPKPTCDECGREIPLERAPSWDVRASTMFCSFKCATLHRRKREAARRAARGQPPPAAGDAPSA